MPERKGFEDAMRAAFDAGIILGWQLAGNTNIGAIPTEHHDTKYAAFRRAYAETPAPGATARPAASQEALAASPVRFCDKGAWRGTGHGVCGMTLDEHGNCPRANGHTDA